MKSFRLFFEAAIRDRDTTNGLTPFLNYIQQNQALPYAIVLKGATSPQLQVLVKQGPKSYIITHERSAMDPKLTPVGRGIHHHNLQDIDKIIRKINGETVWGKKFETGYMGFGLTEQELNEFLRAEGIRPKPTKKKQ